MMQSPTLEQLDAMTAEALPERTVLSTIVVAPHGGPMSHGGGTVVMAACTTSNTYTNPGLLGLLAPQFYAGPIQTMSCVPAVVAT